MGKKKRRGPKLPGYLHHKASGRAFVLIKGRRVYLGKHGTPESKAQYERVIAEYLASGKQARVASIDGDDGVSVVEVIAAYWEHAKSYYKREDGTPTGEADRNIRYALRPLRTLYGASLASEFGPSSLEALRTHMVESGLSRAVVNKRVGIVKRCFRWAESREMVPKGTFHNLATLEPLKAGRSKAHETDNVRPVSWQDVTETIKHLSPTVASMAMLQWECAARPGEVCTMRACDIDRTNAGTWVYSPAQHKTKHRGKGRLIPLFERSQELLRPFLEDIEVGKDSSTFLFRPEGHRARHDHYSTTHYAQAIRRGVAAANAPGRHDAILAATLPMVPEEARQRLEKAVRRLVTNLEPKRVARAVEKQATRLGFDSQPVIEAAEQALEDHEDAVAEWSPNQLRHSAATRIERQLSVEHARIVLGHSDTRMSRNYIEPDVQRAFDALRKLG